MSELEQRVEAIDVRLRIIEGLIQRLLPGESTPAVSPLPATAPEVIAVPPRSEPDVASTTAKSRDSISSPQKFSVGSVPPPWRWRRFISLNYPSMPAG